MHNAPTTRNRPTGVCRLGRGIFLGLLVLACGWSGGCASFTNPIADGIPVRRLPDEVLGKRKDEERTIPPSLLRRIPPDQDHPYRLAPGDVLGVYIQGVLDNVNQGPPVIFGGQAELALSVGFPIPVRDDGTITLPFVDPIEVWSPKTNHGLSIVEAYNLIIKTYTKDKPILKEGAERVLVSLMRARTYNILVVRQDTSGAVGGGVAGAPTSGGGGATAGGGAAASSSSSAGTGFGQLKRGSAASLQLKEGENDVLNALSRTGGLPGLDAENAVIIEHVKRGGQNIRIPLRMRPGEPLPFKPEDIILDDGDIVFIEARDTELFYTGGLLPASQHILPRDYDLDVVQAIALSGGALLNGGVGLNNLSGNIVSTGLGTPSPSLCTVLRRTANGGQINIRVDLNKAFRDPRERILIQAGDFISLQETPEESFVRYLTGVVKYNFAGVLFNYPDWVGTQNVTVP